MAARKLHKYCQYFAAMPALFVCCECAPCSNGWLGGVDHWTAKRGRSWERVVGVIMGIEEREFYVLSICVRADVMNCI